MCRYEVYEQDQVMTSDVSLSLREFQGGVIRIDKIFIFYHEHSASYKKVVFRFHLISSVYISILVLTTFAFIALVQILSLHSVTFYSLCTPLAHASQSILSYAILNADSSVHCSIHFSSYANSVVQGGSVFSLEA